MLNNWLKAVVQQYHENSSDLTKRQIRNILEHKWDQAILHIDSLTFSINEATEHMREIELALKLLKHKDDNDRKKENESNK